MGVTLYEYMREIMRSDQVPWEKIGHMDREAWSEKKRVQFKAIEEAGRERMMRDLHALFPAKQGETSSTDQKADVEMEDEQVVERFYEFMKRGRCKESFTDFADCPEETSNCGELIPRLIKCVDAHSDYYQPIISLTESTMYQVLLEVLSIDEEGEKLPARKQQPNRWFRRFW